LQLGILVRRAEIVEESLRSFRLRSQMESKASAKKLVNLKTALVTMENRSTISNVKAKLASLRRPRFVMQRAKLSLKSTLHKAEAHGRVKVTEALDAGIIHLQAMRRKVANSSGRRKPNGHTPHRKPLPRQDLGRCRNHCNHKA